MRKKFKFIIKIFICIFIIILLLMYKFYHEKNIKQRNSYNHYKVMNALNKNDYLSGKFYAKKIVMNKRKDVYYDMSCVFLYYLYKKENKEKKMNYYKRKIIDSKKSLFKDIINR